MMSALLLDSAANLLVGLALLLAWRASRDQGFARWLGVSFVVHTFYPLSVAIWRDVAGPAKHLAAGGAILSGAVSLTLLMIGIGHLAQRPLSRRGEAWGVAGLTLLGLIALLLGPPYTSIVVAWITTGAGVLAFVWLYPLGRGERLAGAVMILLGLNQFIGLIGPDALIWQTSFAMVLRMVLGFAFFHSAMTRASIEATRLRDQFMHLIDRSHQGLAVMQGETMKYANPALLQIYGLSPDGDPPSASSSNWRDATMPEGERALARERHRRIIEGDLPQAHWEGERRAFDGRKLHLRFSAWKVDWDGEPAEQVVVTDDTAHFDAMETLLHQATHDDLTRLPNRSALLQRLRELCAAGPNQRTPEPFALLLLDVDRFKLFNEAHGPSVGDDVLRALALGLQEALAGRAEVMRLGEDEFALLGLAGKSGDADKAARELCQAVRQLLMHPLVLPRHRFFLDVSMGIALHPADAAEPEALLRSANAAMHEAKRTPGTSVQFAEERFQRGSGATLETEQALRAGMKSDEFTLLYQPKVDATSGALVGFEALVRWDRPGIGRIEPQEFIPAAERNGLIGPLGNLIMTLACQQIALWLETFGTMVPVAVNVSPLQLLDPNFPDLVVRTLRHFNIPAELLTLEITETAAVTHMDQAREQISQMRAHGIEVALDDFGTGFSSLNMLRSLPLSTVKIDRSLIDPMPAPDATAVVKAICDLAAVLHLNVVAEGVETQAHATAARIAGCNALQGYLYARPLDPFEAARWMRGRPELKS